MTAEGRRPIDREPLPSDRSRSALFPFATAHQAALATGLPQVVPLRFYADERGWSLMNLFTGMLDGGQCNYSLLYPGVIKAWHRHQFQSDVWVVVHGMARVGVYDESRQGEPGYRGHSYVIGERNPAAVLIPPPLWHGLTGCGADPCGMLYYVTREYNPERPDEERLPFDAFPAFDWSVENR